MNLTRTTPLPICKAILLCQLVDADEPGKINLTGIVSNVFVDKSLVAPPIELFCQITDAVGHYQLVVEIHDLAANEVIGRSEPTIFDAVDPLMSLNVIFSLAGTRFQRTGLHDIVVFANGEEIDRKQFGVAFSENMHHVVSN